MKKKFRPILIISLVLFIGITELSFVTAGEYTMHSPGGKIRVVVKTGSIVSYSVFFENNIILNPSAISMTLGNGVILGGAGRVEKVYNDEVNKKIYPVVPHKNKEIPDHFSELKLDFRCLVIIHPII